MTSETAARPTVSFGRQFLIWAQRVRLENKAAAVLTLAAIVSGIATYAAFTEAPLGSSADTVYLLLNLDLVLLLLLGAIIARRIVALWVRRRQQVAGARLHVRLVVLFSLVAVTPAILVAAFSAWFFYIGVQSWFSERVSTAVNASLVVAQAYLEEHKLSLRGDVLAMARDINREQRMLVRDPVGFNEYFNQQAALRELTEAYVFNRFRTGLARSRFTLALQLEIIDDEQLDRADQGEVVFVLNEEDDRVRALVRLDQLIDAYLMIGRPIEPEVIAHMQQAESAVADYLELEGRQSALQIAFTLLYVLVAMLLLLGAVWLGLIFADTLVRPIGALIGAAERVRDGDLTARVPGAERSDELGILSRAFNRMTGQLQTQRRELVEANRQLDSRRRFTEAVLSGVSAGVIGLGQEGEIHLPNRSACEFLGREREDLVDRDLVTAIPEMAELMERARRTGGRLVEGQVQLRRGQNRRTLLVRIAGEHADGQIVGYVVTFDDVTELVSAQRKAAWADVARRIAHEIKNPLTPIQLSAERLKRRFLQQIEADPDVFVSCTDTIVRQVGDIGRMVDEFSAFARMPSPVMGQHDLVKLCRQAIELQHHARVDVRFYLSAPPEQVTVPCDSRQVSQVLTNLLQNGIDAIEAREAGPDAGPLPPGRVTVTVTADGPEAEIQVIDNGRGLPPDIDRERLTEPYVTTRSKGTGLGLAIVKKIMEDHGGRLVLEDIDSGGTRATVVFPIGTNGVTEETEEIEQLEPEATGSPDDAAEGGYAPVRVVSGSDRQ